MSETEHILVLPIASQSSHKIKQSFQLLITFSIAVFFSFFSLQKDISQIVSLSVSEMGREMHGECNGGFIHAETASH